jgi:hypothetical protein
MRILLDENFPIDFATLLLGHEVLTVHSLGWAGVKNGDLMRRASALCDVFVTLDRNIEFQQNVKVLTFGVVIVNAKSNRIADLKPHIENILIAANRVKPGKVEKSTLT